MPFFRADQDTREVTPVLSGAIALEVIKRLKEGEKLEVNGAIYRYIPEEMFVERAVTKNTIPTKTFVDAVCEELAKARAAHGNHRSAHESLAVLMEEFEELKAEVFRKNKNPIEMMKELIQLAACCQRMAEDVVEPMFPSGK